MKQKNFQKIGKDGYYRVPDEFFAVTGITGMKENGITLYDGGRFDKAYYCSENFEAVSNYEKVKGCTMLLRGIGVRFCFYELCYPEQKVLLLVSVFAKSLGEAEVAFATLEQDMQGNMYTFGITILPLSAEDKLYRMHQLIMQDAPRARIDVREYMAKTSGWIQDYKLSHYTEHDSYLETKEKCSCVLYVRRVPSEHAARVYRKIKQNAGCSLVVTAYECITDQQVKESLNNNYVGIDSLMQALNRRKIGVGRISEDQDERRYVYAGIYFMLSAESEESLVQNIEQLRKDLSVFHGKIEEYQHYQKNTWQKLASLDPWSVRQTRLIQSGNIVAMNPFYKDEEIPDSVDLGSKAELLAVFDAMTERNMEVQDANY